MGFVSFLLSLFNSPQDPPGYSWSTSALYCSVMAFGSPALHCRVNLDELTLPRPDRPTAISYFM